MKLLEELEYVSVAETKAKLSEKLKSVESRGRRFAITSHGRPKAVIIGYKDYISLVENASAPEAKEMSFDDLRREVGQRKDIIGSVASLFDEKRLTRKGQKGYKREAVRKMAKAARRT
jgi:prevent-host-death family protein